MQDIYYYVPETNHLSRVHSVAAALYLSFVLYVMLFRILNVLYFYISTVLSMYTVPNTAVVCSSLILCFPKTLLR
jgi:hypothetical protein